MAEEKKVKRLSISVSDDTHFVEDLDTLVEYYYNALDGMASVSMSGVLRKLVRDKMIELNLKEPSDYAESED